MIPAYRTEGRVEAMPLDEQLMTLTCGGTGSGKSALSACHAIGAHRDGEAVVVVDPHRTMINEIAGYVEDPVFLSVARDSSPTTAWNPMACDGDVSGVTEDVVDAIVGAMGWSVKNTRAQEFIASAVGCLLEASIDTNMTPTLFEVTIFLLDERFRDTILRNVSERRRGMAERTFGRYPADAVLPVVQPLHRMFRVETYAKVLGQPKPGLDIAQSIEDGRCLLVALSGSSEADQLVASMFLHRMVSEILQGSGRPVRVFMDEAQSYAGAALSVLMSIIEEGRKFGGRAHVIVQQPTRLPKELLSTLLANRSAAFCGKLEEETAAKLMGKQLGVDWQTIKGLHLHRMICDVTVDRAKRGPWEVETMTPGMVWGAPGPVRRGKPLEDPPQDVGRRLLRALRPTPVEAGGRTSL